MEFLLVTYDTSDYYWQNNTPVHNPEFSALLTEYESVKASIDEL